jgi:uncharacterized membrane protein YvlD (DUF360 family)
MAFLIKFVLWCAVSGAILSAIPMVKSKGLGASMAVAAIMSVFQTIISFFMIPVKVVAVLVAFVPFLNIILFPLTFILIALFVNTLALYAADQIIPDFQIDGIGDTALTALILSFCQMVIGVFF